MNRFIKHQPLTASNNTQLLRRIVQYVFLGGSMLGRTTGHWQTDISTNEYLFHIRHLDLPFYQHSRGQLADYNKEAWLRMMKKIREAKVAAHRNARQSEAKN